GGNAMKNRAFASVVTAAALLALAGTARADKAHDTLRIAVDQPIKLIGWTQIDDKTMEFKLRRGVKFTDGTEMTADDVVYSFQYATDPKNNFLFKDSRFGWIDHVEKIDASTVRVYAKQPTAIMLSNLWGGPQIVPEHVRSKLADPAAFGLHPVGTGAYKVESFDPATGRIVLVK